jgi:hypothetical protein
MVGLAVLLLCALVVDVRDGSFRSRISHAAVRTKRLEDAARAAEHGPETMGCPNIGGSS